MSTKNAYKKNARISTFLARKIIRYFSEDLTASKTSALLGIERKTINRWYNYMRTVITHYALKKDKQIRK